MSTTVKTMTPEDLQRLIDDHYALNPGDKLPMDSHIKEVLNRWASDRQMPGDFLCAVLENNLMEAIGRADSYNRATLHKICLYVYNELPSECHGSREKVIAWKRGDG